MAEHCTDPDCGCRCHLKRDARCDTTTCGAWAVNQPPPLDITAVLPKATRDAFLGR